MKYRYIQWDYDNKVAIEFERQNDCNGCGDCCKAVIKFSANPKYTPLNEKERKEWEAAGSPETWLASVDSPHFDARDGGFHVDEKGVWNEVINEKGESRFFRVDSIDFSDTEHRCPSLTVGNMCNVHFEKTLICDSWPFSPAQVTPFKNCSYEFVEVNRWDFE